MPCEGRNKQVPSMIQPVHVVQSVERLPVPGLWVTVLTPVAIWDKDINLNTSQADLKREVLIKCRKTLFPSSLPPLKPLALNLAKVSGCLWSPWSYIQQSVCMCKLLGRPQKLTPSFHKGLPHLPVKTGTSNYVSTWSWLPPPQSYTCRIWFCLDRHSLHSAFLTWKEFSIHLVTTWQEPHITVYSLCFW